MVQVEIKDAEKHERVAKALEQVNGLRYRYRGTVAKSPKKNIDDDSDEGGSTDSEESDIRVQGKRRASSAKEKPRKSNASLSLDEHIERMLLHTRTIALLKIATNTAEVLPDDADDDEDEYEDKDLSEGEEFSEYDEDDEPAFSTTRTEDDEDAEEKSDKFESESVSPPLSSQASSMRRIGSTRRVPSFRSGSSFRGEAASNQEAAAALRLVRKLSTFLSLPKVISYKDLEEITESLLDDPHDESEEYAHLIDEHVDSARESSGDDGSVTSSSLPPRPTASSASLTVRRMATQKSLANLHLEEDPNDLELQQRRLYVENASLQRYSSQNVIGTSSRNLLRGPSQYGLGSHGSLRQLGLSLTASSRDLLAHKESKRSLLVSDPRCRSMVLGPSSITSLPEDKEEEGHDDNAHHQPTPTDANGGVLGTTFDEDGYRQWRTDVSAQCTEVGCMEPPLY